MDAAHGRALSNQYKVLRALVLAGAQSAPGLAIVRYQGLWAWLRAAELPAVSPTTARAAPAAAAATRTALNPAVAVVAPPLVQQLAKIWAQIVLDRRHSTTSSAHP